MPTKLYSPSHYHVLSLPEPTTSSTASTPTEIKLAYKRALLLHHPDKQPRSGNNSTDPKPSIDQIAHAYRILSNASLRADYDRTLLFDSLSAPDQNPSTLKDPSFYAASETIDLDDMQFDTQQGVYYRSCRCGRDRAYVVRDEDLEAHARGGDISVGCEGCSLWVRIEFLVAEAA